MFRRRYPFVLPPRVRLIHRLLACCHYRISVTGTPCRGKPVLFIVSHRSGASDGTVAAYVLGGVPSLVSVQLVRNPLLRLLFDGIPVVRDKDRERYGITADSVPPPLVSAAEQIKAGGSLCLYPEGTSEWQCRPLPYHGGMGVLAARLKAAGTDFTVQPVGLFYAAPDHFRSRVSIVFGEAFQPQGSGAKAIQAELSAALDAVSVCCPDNAAFNAAQTAAWQAAQHGQDYGTAFLKAQRQSVRETVPMAQPPARLWAKILFTAAFPLVAAGGRLAQRFADGRNNTTFFRMLGALAALPFQAACYALLLFYAPAAALLLAVCGAVGWAAYPEAAPEPLE